METFKAILALGYRIDRPLPVLPIFDLIGDRGGVEDAEMFEVFNMGCGFCCVVREPDADAALEILSERHPGSSAIGRVTDHAGVVES